MGNHVLPSHWDELYKLYSFKDYKRMIIGLVVCALADYIKVVLDYIALKHF